jgi:phage terminase Nu1 subunit (DNA packaging protein)
VTPNNNAAIGAKAKEIEAQWGASVDLLAIVREAWQARGETARTYRELAEHLGLTCADPERTLKAYHARGMPGTVGTRGKQDGRFDVEVCRSWIAAHVRAGGGAESGDLRERILQLELEIKEREKLESLERLADVDEVGQHVETCVNDARAILEAIPDEVVRALPDETESQVRSVVHRRVEQLIRDACDHLARMAAGDDDLIDEPDTNETASKPSVAAVAAPDRGGVAAAGKRRPGGVGRGKRPAKRPRSGKRSVRSRKPTVVARAAKGRR